MFGPNITGTLIGGGDHGETNDEAKYFTGAFTRTGSGPSKTSDAYHGEFCNNAARFDASGGFSERDRTPEATMTVATRLAPGIAEAIRAGSMKITKRAMLSRETSVIRNKTLIVNLPGSPKAVAESLELVIDQLDHGIKILLGRTGECARN